MAIAHGTTTVATVSSTTITISSVTVTGTDAGLIVKLSYKSNSTQLNSVVWDSVGVNESLTQLGTEESNGNARASLWYLAAPTAKTANVTITLNSSSRTVAAASVYTGVDQVNPFRAAAVAGGNGTNSSPTVDVVALNTEMVVDCLAQVSAGPHTATGDHTERHDSAATGGGTDTRGASQEVASTGATETMGWTMSGSDNWAVIAAPLQVAGTTPESSFIPQVTIY